MPSIVNGNTVSSKKRKRVIVPGTDAEALPQKKPQKSVAKQNAAQIAELEAGIGESQKNLNNIATLLSLAKKDFKLGYAQSAASIALCRVFCRLQVDGRLTRSSASSEKELTVIEWLRARYTEYQYLLLDRLQSGDSAASLPALSLCMQLVREDVSNAKESSWKIGLFPKIVAGVLADVEGSELCQEFAKTYVQPYDDVRHYTFLAITQLLKTDSRDDTTYEHYRANSLLIMSTIDPLDTTTTTKLTSLFGHPSSTTKPLLPTAHRKAGQQAWLSLTSTYLTKSQRKTLLTNMVSSILPWFPTQVELLMDFLTDSYNHGGSTSLLALSGLFHLMTAKNLDYPAFYPTLYSLLTPTLLHSQHRSRFFRLLTTFMSSTHLPATLVASFIKRLARLALSAPPAAIVAVIPWIYNMLQTHPTCTFMIHRVVRSEAERRALEANGASDVFDMDEVDPGETRAIDSCLWELVTLQRHYHPNVASLAGIVAEQFTKRAYNLDDFLDHSYASLLEAELGKDLKRAPVVEFEIPKTIFTTKDGDDTLAKLMTSVLETA